MSNGLATAEVISIGQLNLSGNIHPSAWFHYLKLPSGKPDLIGIIILGEIVYWYRPRMVRDESTGEIIRVERRFHADLLQRSYDSFSSQFGISKREAINAIKRLEEKKVLKRVLRNVKTSSAFVSNVLYIAINPEMIKKISQLDPSHFEKRPLPLLEVTPPSFKSDTYTETTTKTSTKTNTLSLTTLDDSFNQDAFNLLEPSTEWPVNKKKKTFVNFDEFLTVWNKFCGDLPKSSSLNEKRKAGIKAIVSEHKEQALERFKEAVLGVASNDWWIDQGYGIDNLLKKGRVTEKAERYRASPKRSRASLREELEKNYGEK